MPRIKIFRKKDWFIRYRVFEIFLDGQKMGYLSNGESIEFDAPAGQHKLRVKMGRLRSKDFNYTVYNKENKSFTVSRNQIIGMIIIILIFLVTFMEFFIHRIFKMERRVLEFITVTIVLFHSYGGKIHFLNIKET